ncbi:MAG: hypothetical protein ACOH2M_31815 [Cypionkella sp.]
MNQQLTEQRAAISEHAAALNQYGGTMHPEDLQGAPLELRSFIRKCETGTLEDLSDQLAFLSEALRHPPGNDTRSQRYHAIRGPFKAYVEAAMNRRFPNAT